MATHRVSILGWGTCPDTTGECFLEPYDILATNDVWKRLVGRFGSSNAAQPTLKHGLYGGFHVPKNYVSAPKIVVVWSATLTSGDISIGFDYRSVGGDDTTSLDQAGTEESVTTTDTAPGAANRRMEKTLTLTAGNLSIDEEIEFYFYRDGTAGADTMAGSMLLFSLLLEYADV